MTAMARSRLQRILPVKRTTARAVSVVRKARCCRGPALEALEPRLVLAPVLWTGGGDGKSWQDGNNWSTHAVPGTSDDVTINVANNPTIISNGSVTIQSLVD